MILDFLALLHYLVNLSGAGYNWVYGGDIRVSGIVPTAISVLIDDDQLFEVLAVLKSQITVFWDLRACSLMGAGRNRVLRKVRYCILNYTASCYPY